MTDAAAALARRILTDLTAWDAASPEERSLAARHVDALLPDFRLRAERPLETFSCGGQTHEIGVFLHVPTQMEFSLIPVGTFQMGSPPDEPGREANEPYRRVKLTRPYLIARTEVTWQTWGDVMEVDDLETRGLRRPAIVSGVSVTPLAPSLQKSLGIHESAPGGRYVTFCERTGLRLPTEAEWEYACRAGTSTPWCTGDREEDLARVAVDAPSGEGGCDVASLAPNAFGLFDVHGNSQEFCIDNWVFDLGHADVIDPVVVGDDMSCVMKGGGHHRYPPGFRSAARFGAGLLLEFGFRPVATVEPR